VRKKKEGEEKNFEKIFFDLMLLLFLASFLEWLLLWYQKHQKNKIRV